MHLLDANAFMEANRLYYGFDIAPGFWTWLADPTLAGQVASIDAVKDEITAGTGDLVDWARARPDTFWLTDTDVVLLAMREVAAWAADPARQYRQEAVDETQVRRAEDLQERIAARRVEAARRLAERDA